MRFLSSFIFTWGYIIFKTHINIDVYFFLFLLLSEGGGVSLGQYNLRCQILVCPHGLEDAMQSEKIYVAPQVGSVDALEGKCQL